MGAKFTAMRGDCAFQDGSYPCGYKDGDKLPDCRLCHKIRKAGIEEEYKKWVRACMKAGMLISKPEELINLYKAGIREVVEWISRNSLTNTRNADDTGEMLMDINKTDWQAQLKEWFKDQPELLKEWEVKNGK